jgi:hypothetical protein
MMEFSNNIIVINRPASDITLLAESGELPDLDGSVNCHIWTSQRRPDNWQTVVYQAVGMSSLQRNGFRETNHFVAERGGACGVWLDPNPVTCHWEKMVSEFLFFPLSAELVDAQAMLLLLVEFGQNHAI